MHEIDMKGVRGENYKEERMGREGRKGGEKKEVDFYLFL